MCAARRQKITERQFSVTGAPQVNSTPTSSLLGGRREPAVESPAIHLPYLLNKKIAVIVPDPSHSRQLGEVVGSLSRIRESDDIAVDVFTLRECLSLTLNNFDILLLNLPPSSFAKGKLPTKVIINLLKRFKVQNPKGLVLVLNVPDLSDFNDLRSVEGVIVSRTFKSYQSVFVRINLIQQSLNQSK
ncbi:MAG: hypothetical protein ABID61_05590 [Candidatus Micrarchaeota archaeon]